MLEECLIVLYDQENKLQTVLSAFSNTYNNTFDQ